MIHAVPLSQGDLSGSSVFLLARRPVYRQNPRLVRFRRIWGPRSGSMDRLGSNPTAECAQHL